MTSREYDSITRATEEKLGIRNWTEDPLRIISALSDEVLEYVVTQSHPHDFVESWVESCGKELIERLVLRGENDKS